MQNIKLLHINKGIKAQFTTQMKLKKAYYLEPNVVKLAKDLLGKVLVTREGKRITSGIITETEAYNGIVDKASHAYGNRRTNRTEIMFKEGGTSYVYLCYGIHYLFNVVTNVKDHPHAVLIRAIQPLEGKELILRRRGVAKADKKLCIGPGKVSQALGIDIKYNGLDLTGDKIWIEDRGIKIKRKDILVGPRIGVDYAGEDAKLPYRFWIEKNLAADFTD
jgi:DNA-3-methyladenine glycosylase